MRRSIAILVLALAAPLGCDSSKPAGGSGAASAQPSASSALAAPGPTSAATSAPGAPENLDVAELQKAMKCANDAKSGACGVLTKVATCTPWSAVAPSGDGRWIGRGTVIQGGKTADQVTLIRARSVPLSEVGPGQLPAKIAITEIPKEEGAAFDQADRAIHAYERNDVPQRASPTVEYIKKRTDWPEAYAMRTAGGQVVVLSQAGSYICQGPRQQLLLVQRGATRGSNTDGVYAELWPTSW